jgi:hypothetical protein
VIEVGGLSSCSSQCSSRCFRWRCTGSHWLGLSVVNTSKLNTSVSLVRFATADDAQPMGEILHHGLALGVIVEGAVLEAAVDVPLQCGQGLLLFLTDDVPFEEMLRVTLIGPDRQVLDQVELGGPYTTGSLRDLRVLSAHTMRFNFIGDTDWTLQVLPSVQWILPWAWEPRGVSRKWPWRRQLVMSGHPKPGG